MITLGGEEVGFKYSTEEQWTGKYDTDGKKIYRRYVEWNIKSAPNIYMTHNWNVKRYEIIYGDWTEANTKVRYWFPYSYANSNEHLSIRDLSTNTVVLSSSWNATVRLTLEYTCNDR